MLVAEQLDVARGVGELVAPAEQAEGGRALREDVQAPVVRALEHARDRGGTADLAQAGAREPHDAELASGGEALADHRLVALLEDVKRDELVRQKDEPEREEGKALEDLGHPQRG